MDSELTPQEGRDPGLMPADQDAGTWKIPLRGQGAGNPLEEGSREPSQGQERPAGPGQAPPSGGYSQSSSYGRPAASAGYQPVSGGYQAGSSGGFAPSSPSVFDRPASYDRPSGSSGYQSPGSQGGSSGYQSPGGAGGVSSGGYQPAGQSGYDRPASPPGYQPNELSGYDRLGGAQGYQPSAQPGYDRSAGPSGYQPPAQPGYQPAPPLPGDVAATRPGGYQPSGQPGGGNPGYPYAGGPGQPASQGYPTRAYAPAQGYQGPQSYQNNPYQQTQPYQVAQPQPGYGPAWPGAGPPPQRKRGKGMLVGIIVVVAALIVGGVTAFIVLRGGESPTQMAMEAGQAIAPAKGLSLSGTYDQAPAAVTVTKAGTVEGTYSQGPFAVTRLTIGGVTYLKAPAGFWNLQTNIPQGASSLAAGKWAKTPTPDVTSFGGLLPGVIAGVLEHVGSAPHVVNTTLGGNQVIKLTSQDASYYITTSAPNRLLRIDGSINGTAYSFNITSLTSQTIAPTFSAMHSDVQSLLNAIDPEAQIDEDGNGQFGNNCNNDTSCTVSVNVSVTDSGSPTVLVRMTANFSGTKNGKSFGTCTDMIPANTANSSKKVTVSASCTLTGSTWSGWFDSHTSNFFLWVATQSEPTVNSANDIATLQSDLSNEQG